MWNEMGGKGLFREVKRAPCLSDTGGLTLPPRSMEGTQRGTCVTRVFEDVKVIPPPWVKTMNSRTRKPSRFIMRKPHKGDLTRAQADQIALKHRWADQSSNGTLYTEEQ